MSKRTAKQRRTARLIASAARESLERLWPVNAPEPRTVFELFCTRRAVETWRNVIDRARAPITYSAVFTHQRPYVRFGTGTAIGKCEIADLLLVLSFPSKRKRQAMLLQAKKMKNLRWPPSDDQWSLYSGWPTFAYTVGGKRRLIEMPSHRPLRRAQYLLLPPDPGPVVFEARPESPRFFGRPTARGRRRTGYCPSCGGSCRFAGLGWANSFVQTFSDLALRNTGAAFDFLPTPQMDGWSTLVWDLLSVTALQNAPRRQVGAASPGRPLRGSLSLFMSGAQLPDLASGRTYGTQATRQQSESAEGGFGVVHMVVGSNARTIDVEGVEGPWND